jgi:hypothetical protein
MEWLVDTLGEGDSVPQTICDALSEHKCLSPDRIIELCGDYNEDQYRQCVSNAIDLSSDLCWDRIPSAVKWHFRSLQHATRQWNSRTLTVYFSEIFALYKKADPYFLYFDCPIIPDDTIMDDTDSHMMCPVVKFDRSLDEIESMMYQPTCLINIDIVRKKLDNDEKKVDRFLKRVVEYKAWLLLNGRRARRELSSLPKVTQRLCGRIRKWLKEHSELARQKLQVWRRQINYDEIMKIYRVLAKKYGCIPDDYLQHAKLVLGMEDSGFQESKEPQSNSQRSEPRQEQVIRELSIQLAMDPMNQDLQERLKKALNRH